jgi:hypothetical protein
MNSEDTIFFFLYITTSGTLVSHAECPHTANGRVDFRGKSFSFAQYKAHHYITFISN